MPVPGRADTKGARFQRVVLCPLRLQQDLTCAFCESLAVEDSVYREPRVTGMSVLVEIFTDSLLCGCLDCLDEWVTFFDTTKIVDVSIKYCASDIFALS